MAASLSDLEEAVRSKNPADIATEKARSLPDRDLDLGHIDFAAPASFDFLGGRRLQEERDRFLEVSPFKLSRLKRVL